MSQQLRQKGREIFWEALAACRVDAGVKRMLRAEAGRLQIGNRSYHLPGFSDVRVVAIGKAGTTLFHAVRPLLGQEREVAAVLSAPVPPATLGGRDRYFAGGHPLPNAASLQAAGAALELLRGATERTLVLFLVSGGASAMFEAPLSPEVTLTDLLELNRRLVGSGAPIAEINCVRKHLSAVKGGRLLAAAGPATCVSLLVSDVPAGQLDALGSGPTLPDSTTVADCRRVVETYLDGAASLPASFARMLVAGIPETPKISDPVFARAHTVVLLENTQLIEAAAAAARRMGFHVEVDNRCDDWSYEEAAEYLLERLRELKKAGGALCLLSGGEVTVRLPEKPGTGGRNQQWVLRCAERLHGTGERVTVLSAGSDGIDGTSPAAGAVADETTWARASAAGLDPQRHLAAFDAYPLFRGLGDAVEAGPTGNNLRDLRVLLWDPDELGSRSERGRAPGGSR